MASCYVICRECGQRHDTESVEFVDICEGGQGQDVLTYICPETKNKTESNVYRGYFERGW
jgi:hypothetical protein